MPRTEKRRVQEEEEGDREIPYLKIARSEGYDVDFEDDGSEKGEHKKGKDSEPRREAIKVSREYMQVADAIANSYSSPEEQRMARIVLGRKDSITMYQDMRKAKYSKKEAIDMLKESIPDLARGEKVPSFKAYEGARARGDERRAQYVEFIGYLVQDGILEEEEGQKYIKRIEKIRESRHRSGKSLLEQMAKTGVWLFMAIGAVLMLLSGYSMTGAVTGSMFEVSSLFVLGLVLFIAGLVLKIKK